MFAIIIHTRPISRSKRVFLGIKCASSSNSKENISLLQSGSEEPLYVPLQLTKHKIKHDLRLWTAHYHLAHEKQTSIRTIASHLCVSTLQAWSYLRETGLHHRSGRYTELNKKPGAFIGLKHKIPGQNAKLMLHFWRFDQKGHLPLNGWGSKLLPLFKYTMHWIDYCKIKIRTGTITTWDQFFLEPSENARGLAVGSSWTHWENKPFMCIRYGYIELEDLYRRSKFN